MKKILALIFALLMFSTTAFAVTEESKLHEENNEGDYGCSVTIETCESVIWTKSRYMGLLHIKI